VISDDIRALAGVSPGQTVVNVATTDTPLVPQSPSRVCLIIGAPPTNRVTLTWSGAAVLDQGVTLYPAQPPLVLTAQEHGALCTGAVRAISATLAQNVAYTETVKALG